MSDERNTKLPSVKSEVGEIGVGRVITTIPNATLATPE